MLEAINLACERGERTLFHHLSFDLREGQALLVQGANGSGKTSLLRMVCGLLAPAAGEIRWRGAPTQRERAAFHAETAYFGHMPAVKDELSALENLDFTCRLGGHPRARGELEEALARMGLAHCLDLPVKALSQGQRRRVALARLPLSKAALWVLDEPLTALDQAAAQEVQTLIGAHLQGGGMALLTTHQPLTLPGCEPGVLALS
jgi:heme exporter protein A